MLWMLLVYVVAANGYAGPPVITPSFHGATFPTKDECLTAARAVEMPAPGKEVDDIAKAAVITVCAPAQPAPPPSSAAQASADPVQAQDPFPPNAATPPGRKK